MFATVKDLIDKLAQMRPQSSIDGEHDIWILKPSCSSRGVGIFLTKDL
jgi:hypothetical protein